MLYNKNWDAKTVTSDPFTLESLIAWLEKQPAAVTYNWHDCNGACLIGIYFAVHGHPWDARRYCNFTDFNTRSDIAGTEPFTFGAALTRARKALAAR